MILLSWDHLSGENNSGDPSISLNHQPGALPAQAIPLHHQPVALTVGVFDGLHIGHQNLIRGIVRNPYRALPLILTFRQNPAQVLGSGAVTGSVLSFRQKLNKLAALGVAAVVLIDFSYEFSTLTGKDFIRELRTLLDIKKVVVGYNFNFGKDRDTNAGQLEAMLRGSGVEVAIIQPSFYRNELVSSSRIRSAIIKGHFTEVREMLADDYRLDLPPEVRRVGGKNRIPLQSLTQVLPQAGRYRVLFRSGSEQIPSILEISADEISWQAGKQEIEEVQFIEKWSE